MSEARVVAPVVAKTLVTVAVFASVTYLSFEAVLPASFPAFLRLAVAFSATMAVAIGILVTAVLISKALAQARGRRAERTLPVIRDHLARHVAGSDSSRHLARLGRLYPREFSEALMAMLEALTGASAERLSRLAIDQGLLQRWQAQARSKARDRRVEAINKIGLVNDPEARETLRQAFRDPSLRVRMIASRLLLRSRLATEIEEVFRFAMRQPLLVRAVVEDEMRPHVPLLLDLAVPEALASGEPEVVVNTLSMLRAWGVTIPAELIDPLLEDADAEVRALSLELLPWMVPARDHSELLRRRLATDLPQNVRVAAANAAGRMHAVATSEALDGCLASGPAAVALAAARALAMLGAEGLAKLERRIDGADRGAAAVALEAIEKQRMGRLGEAAI